MILGYFFRVPVPYDRTLSYFMGISVMTPKKKDYRISEYVYGCKRRVMT